MASENPNQRPPETKGSNEPSEKNGGGTALLPLPAEWNPPQAPPSHALAPKKQRDWHDYAMLIIQGVGVFFLIAYTTFAALQWCEMKKTATAAIEANKSADKTFRLTNRAHVTVVGGPGRYQSDSTVPLVGVTLMVTGNNPASSVRRSIKWDVKKIPLPSLDHDYLGDPPYLVEKFSFQWPDTESLSTKVNLSEAQRKQIESGHYAVILWGTVEYITFEETHHTRFCWVMQSDFKGASQRCPVHADAD